MTAGGGGLLTQDRSQVLGREDTAASMTVSMGRGASEGHVRKRGPKPAFCLAWGSPLTRQGRPRLGDHPQAQCGGVGGEGRGLSRESGEEVPTQRGPRPLWFNSLPRCDQGRKGGR